MISRDYTGSGTACAADAGGGRCTHWPLLTLIAGCISCADVDGSQPRQYKVHTLAGLIQPALLADGQVRSFGVESSWGRQGQPGQ